MSRVQRPQSFSESRDPNIWPGQPEESPRSLGINRAFEEADGIDSTRRESGGHKPDTSRPGDCLLLAVAYPNLFPVIREFDENGLIF